MLPSLNHQRRSNDATSQAPQLTWLQSECCVHGSKNPAVPDPDTESTRVFAVSDPVPACVGLERLPSRVRSECLRVSDSRCWFELNFANITRRACLSCFAHARMRLLSCSVEF
eukprot:1258175-Rhodomonas_salina.1